MMTLHDDFINALLEYWQSKYTEQIITAVERLKAPINQRRELGRSPTISSPS